MLRTPESSQSDQHALSATGIPLPPVDIMVLARPNTVTEERSDTRDPTGNPTYGILRPTSSSEVYRVGRYYVGVLKELPPPDIIYDEWNEHICGDLINHLLAVTDSLPNDIPDDHLIIEPVLCMAGKTKSMRLTTHERHARGKVMLEPMVWIHCGSRKCRRKVKETIHQARFLQNFLQRFGMAEAHIALEAPWPAAHIASTADQQYSSASEEQKVSVDDQDRRLYDSGYDSASLMSYTPSISSLMYSEMSSRSMWQPSSTASTSPSQPGNRIPFISQHYYSSPPSIHGQLSQWPLTVSHEAPAFPGARTRNLPYSRRGSNVDHPPMSLSASEYAENGSSDSYIRPRQTICDVDDRQLALSFAIQLRYDIHSACGIGTRFCLHDSGSSFSTIGGLIVVDNSVFGLTTAHGIIACLDASKTPSSSDTDEDTSESGSDSDPSFPVGISKPRNRRRDYSRGSEVATQGTAQHEWSPVLVPSIVSYKGRGTLTGDYGLPTQSPPMSDFALVELDCNLLGTLKNSYRDPSTSIIKDISGSLDNNQLSAGEVLIITSSNVIPGYLLDGTASVILRGTAMRTKKIQIQISHGEGISGAWVVRDHLVCGCIFAAYNTGRYLHMLPIEDTLRSISQFTNSTSVRIATTNDLAGPPSPASKHPAGLPGDMPDVIRNMSLQEPETRLFEAWGQTLQNAPPGIISPRSSSTLDPRYQVPSDPRRFFRQGRVFSIMRHENAGTAAHRTNATIIAGQFGEPVYSHIRRMVVVKEYTNCAWCFPIYTYRNQGLSKSGTDSAKQAVIYMEGSEPVASLSDPRMLSKALEVRPASSDIQLSPMSRLNFAKLFTVEHNVKVLHIGRITERSMPDFLTYARRELWV